MNDDWAGKLRGFALFVLIMLMIPAAHGQEPVGATLDIPAGAEAAAGFDVDVAPADSHEIGYQSDPSLNSWWKYEFRR